MGTKPYLITREQILNAINHTTSNMAASRFLGVGRRTYQKYAKMYKIDENNEFSQSIYHFYNRKSQKGIKKRRKGKNIYDTKKIIEEGEFVYNQMFLRVKEQLFADGHLKDECMLCNFNKKRYSDYKPPLVLHFKDNDKRNFRLENLEVYCYNCYFLYKADPLSGRELKIIEQKTYKDKRHNFELDAQALESIKLLGLNLDFSELEERINQNIISYKK